MLLKPVRFMLIILLLIQMGYAQNFMVLNKWRLYRNEFSINFGTTNFLGDLGGRDRIGSDFIYDLEKTLFKPGVTLDYRYYMTRTLVWRQSFSYGVISGDDKLTAEPFRNNRNLSFKSNILEFSTMLEWQIMPEKDSRRHNLRNHKGKQIGWKYHTRGFYVFAGVGGTYFEPKAKYQGRMYKLRTLHTEGQGLSGGPAPYKPFTVVIPVGAGFKYVLSHQWSLTLEISHRFTFTDYMDDVSTDYYDAISITSAYGPAAGYLSNPSLQSSQIGYDPTRPGLQRGDPTDRDSYLFMTLGVHFRLHNDYRPPYSAVKHGKRRRYSRAIF